MLVFLNVFLVAFALDAGISLLHDLLRGVGVPAGLPELRNLVAYPVALASFVVFLWMGFSPRIPKAVFLPLCLFVFWWLFGGFPVPLVADSAVEFATIGSVLQVAIAASAFLVVRQRTDGLWLLGPDQVAGPNFRFGHTLGYFVGAAVLGAPLLLVSLLMSTVLALESRTNGFIDFKRDGMHLTERVYAKGDHSVALVGMMHIGSADAYRELFESFSQPSTVLLQEGVTDRDGRLESGLDYEPLAKALGLDVQLDPRDVIDAAHEGQGDDETEPWPHVRHADVDLAEFSDESIAFLTATADMITHEDLAVGFREFQTFVEEADPKLWEQVEADIITSRNRVLVEKLDEALGEYDHIVVPWGALHLPEVETAVRERGFAESSTKQHLLFRYGAIATALSNLANRSAETAGGPDAAADAAGDETVDAVEATPAE